MLQNCVAEHLLELYTEVEPQIYSYSTHLLQIKNLTSFSLLSFQNVPGITTFTALLAQLTEELSTTCLLIITERLLHCM